MIPTALKYHNRNHCQFQRAEGGGRDVILYTFTAQWVSAKVINSLTRDIIYAAVNGIYLLGVRHYGVGGTTNKCMKSSLHVRHYVKCRGEEMRKTYLK